MWIPSPPILRPCRSSTWARSLPASRYWQQRWGGQTKIEGVPNKHRCGHLQSSFHLSTKFNFTRPNSSGEDQMPVAILPVFFFSLLPLLDTREGAVGGSTAIVTPPLELPLDPHRRRYNSLGSSLVAVILVAHGR